MLVQLMHSEFDADHLAEVIAEMRVLGAPTVKAVDCGNHWVALEGCHRLRAAHELGLEPEIEAVEYSADVTRGDLGLDGDDYVTVEQAVDGAHDRCTTVLEF